MKKSDTPEELFKKIKDKLNFSPDNKPKLSKEDIDYLSAIILLELDKGKRLNTLSKMDNSFIDSLRAIVEKKAFPKKDSYTRKSTDSKIDKKV